MSRDAKSIRYASLLSPEKRMVLQIIFKGEFEIVGVNGGLPENIVNLPDFVKRLSQDFDYLILPLTLRSYASLRIAETIHKEKLLLKTVLVTESATTNEINSRPLFDFYVSWKAISIDTKHLWPNTDRNAINRLPRAKVERQVRRFLSRELCFYWRNASHPPSKPTYDEYKKDIRDDATRPYLSVWYLSYAWGDKTPEGIERDRAVNLFCERAAQNKYLIARDKDIVKVGDSLVEFMEQVGRGEKIFIIISDKYLKSENCMYELTEIWRVSQQDGQMFMRKIRVYTLPDAKIWSFSDRLQYAIYWKAKFQSVKEALSGSDPTLGGQSGFRNMLLLERFYQEIADILQNIVDTLQPASIDELADVNFYYDP